MKIPIIINNRDLYTWPVAMIHRMMKYHLVGDIIVVDNESTYPPLIHWYDRQNIVRVVKCSNLGHAGAWISGVVRELDSDYYVVTDGDLNIDNTPDDTLMVLLEKMKTEPELGKVGLGLDWQIVNSESPYYQRLRLYEKDRWEKSNIVNGIYTDVHIDTTFALYNVKHYFIGGGSLTFPYVARHLPWELTKKEAMDNKEFRYYVENAQSSCSYKMIVPFTSS